MAALLSTSLIPTLRADYAAEVMSENPIVYYRFNDGVTTDDLPSPAVNLGSAGVAANGSYTGTFVRGVPGALPGSANTAVQGTGNLVEIPNSPAINNAGSFSVETWLKPTSIPAATALISPIASFRENDNVYGRAGWLIYQGDAATGFNFRAYNRNGSTFTFSITSGAGTVTAGAWHHVVATWDSVANQGKLYVNGVLRATSAVVTPSGPNNSTYEPNNTRPFTLGSRDGAFPWSGDLDEPAYYTSVLSDAQVLAHYNNGISPSPSQTYDSLVLAAAPAGYWRVGEAAFTPRTSPVADNIGSLGNSGDGAYYAGSKNAATGPSPSSGFQGFSANNSSLSLATANGHVGTAMSLLNGRSAFTVMGWVKRGAVHSTRGGYFGQNDLLEFGDATNGADIESYINARGGNMITPYSFADDQWGFIALTGDTTKSTLFLNGVQVAQMTGNIAGYGTSAFNFNIGGGGIFAATGDYFRGEIDEVAVFDKAVTPGRVKQLYDAATGGVSVEFVDTTPAITPLGDIPEGQQFTLSVDTNGTPPFAYQWKKNGVDVPNSNSRTLTVTAAANTPITEPYEYTVVVSNLGGAASITSDPVFVYVTPALKWTGTDPVNPGKWTIGGPINWKTFTAGTATAYSDDFAAVFDDSGTALTATLTDPVAPVSLIVDSDTKNYTIAGPSLTTGTAGIVKNGASTLLLDVNDVFVSSVTINEGTLKLGSGMGIGLYNGAAVAVNGGTLDIGLPTGTPYANATTVAAGASLTVTGTGDLSLAATGTGISGAGGEVFNRAGTVTVNTSNTVGGSVAIQAGKVVFDGSQNVNRLAASQTVTLSPGTTMEIQGVNALPTAANSVSVVLDQATLNVVTGGSAAIGPEGTSHAHLKNLTLSSSSVVLGYSGAGGAYNGESFQLNGGITLTGSSASTISLGSGTNAGNSGVAISGNATHTIDVENAAVGSDLIINAELENTDAAAADSAAAVLSKVGVGTLKLADGIAHGFSGTMQVSAGTLEATGSLAGPLNVLSGGTVVPGNGVVGTLGAGGNSALSGTYRCDIDGAVSDKLTVTGNLTLGAGATIALNIGSGGVTAPFYQLASCTGTLSGTLPTLTGTIPPGYSLVVVSSSSLVLAQGTINTQPMASGVVPSGNEDFSTSGGGFTVSAPVSPETDWAYGDGTWLSFGTDAATGVGTNTTYLTTPIYTVTAAGPVTISFSHAYNFEVDYDAGALEISVNGGDFTYLPGSAFTSNGYAANPLPAATNSALKEQYGFLGASAGYPAFHTTTATLLPGAAMGDTVQVRFMGAYDDAFSAGGWEIDSFSITNALPSLMKLEWPLGIMQYSDTLQPPWTDLSGTSPLLIDTKAAAKRFFRLKP